MKFLIIDDSVLGRRMARKAVESLGHTAIESDNGLSGLERYVVEKPDYVLLDLVMPDISGFQVLEMLMKADAKCRVIVCTADVQKQSRDAVTASGALGIVNKPITAESLQALLLSPSVS